MIILLHFVVSLLALYRSAAPYPAPYAHTAVSSIGTTPASKHFGLLAVLRCDQELYWLKPESIVRSQALFVQRNRYEP